MCKYDITTREKTAFSFVMYIMANCCMPTLMKIKPASIVNISKQYIDNVRTLRNVLDSKLYCFGCNYEILFENQNVYVALIYNSTLLEATLNKFKNNYIFNLYGYEFENNILHSSIYKFKERFVEYKNGKIDFPHELGVFLGYPIEDVEDYIINKGEKYKLCGFWKVYHDVESAEKTFELFRLIRREAVNLISSGKELVDMNIRMIEQGI